MNLMDILNEIRGYRMRHLRDPDVIVVDTATYLGIVDALHDLCYKTESSDKGLYVGGIKVVDRKDILDPAKSKSIGAI